MFKVTQIDWESLLLAVTKPSTSIEMVPNSTHSDATKFSGAVGNGRVMQGKTCSTQTTDDGMSDGELEEDTMDISRNDVDEAELSLYSPNPLTKDQDTSGSADDDDFYEPPSEISMMERQEPDPDVVLLYQDLKSAKDDSPAATQNQPSADQDAEPIEKPISGEPSLAPNADMAGNKQSQRSLSRNSSLADTSDSDDYEPPEPAPLGEEVPQPAQFSSADSEKSFSPPDVDTSDFIAPTSSDPTPAVHQQVGVDAITVGARSHSVRYYSSSPMLADTNQVQKLEPKRKTGRFTPYESPLKQFKSFRYHPQYLEEVSHGFRSLTYSHTINPDIPLCRYELDGVCNDDSCQSQHLRSIGLSGALIEA